MKRGNLFLLSLKGLEESLLYHQLKQRRQFPVVISWFHCSSSKIERVFQRGLLNPSTSYTVGRVFVPIINILPTATFLTREEAPMNGQFLVVPDPYTLRLPNRLVVRCRIDLSDMNLHQNKNYDTRTPVPFSMSVDGVHTIDLRHHLYIYIPGKQKRGGHHFPCFLSPLPNVRRPPERGHYVSLRAYCNFYKI